MMNNLLEKIFNFKSQHVHLFFLSKSDKKGDFDVFSTKPDLEVLSDIKTAIHSQINDYIANEDSENPMEYDPIFVDNAIVQKINCDELTRLPNFLDRINIYCEVYDKTKLKKGHKLWLVAILMDDGEDKILAFQKIRSRTLLESGKKMPLSIDEEISKFDNQLLVLENKIDCICLIENGDLTNHPMYIFHKYYFEQIFGFEEKFKNDIKKMLGELEFDDESIKLDVDKLYSTIENNSRSLKKLYVILDNENFKYLTEENLEKIETKGNNLKFNRSNGILKLDSYDDVKKILNLLNDDYLEGIISQKPFKTSNKVNF